MKKTILVTIFVSLLIPSLACAFDNTWQDFDRRQAEDQARHNRRMADWQMQEELRKIQREIDDIDRRSYSRKTSYEQNRPSSGDKAVGMALGGFNAFIQGEKDRRRRER